VKLACSIAQARAATVVVRSVHSGGATTTEI